MSDFPETVDHRLEKEVGCGSAETEAASKRRKYQNQDKNHKNLLHNIVSKLVQEKRRNIGSEMLSDKCDLIWC